MPRVNTPENTVVDGATALGLTAVDDTLEGVEEVKQHQHANVVIDFTDPKPRLIPTGTELNLQIKGQKFGYTSTGWPKVSYMYVVDGSEYDGEAFFDDLMFIPAQPPKRGTMWRVDAFAKSVGYTMPETGTQKGFDEFVAWIKEDFTEQMLGETLRAVVKIETSDQVNPKTGELYEPRNKIDKFIPMGSRSLDDLFSS